MTTDKEMKRKVNVKQLKVYQKPQSNTADADQSSVVPPAEGSAVLTLMWK